MDCERLYIELIERLKALGFRVREFAYRYVEFSGQVYNPSRDSLDAEGSLEVFADCDVAYSYSLRGEGYDEVVSGSNLLKHTPDSTPESLIERIIGC